jgi:hypothetical protein
MKRLKISSKMRLEMFFKANNQCQSCQAKIHPGHKWELDHIIPLAMGGADTKQNMQILCKICHNLKTYNKDISEIAKAKRLQMKHFGAKRITEKPMLGSKASLWKKKIRGGYILR